MFEFFSENELISHNQSGFKPGDSCIKQLLCITHDIYQSLDDGLETRAVFLNISKTFDKVWHKGLLFKLKQNGILGNLFKCYHRCFVSEETKSCFKWTALVLD